MEATSLIDKWTYHEEVAWSTHVALINFMSQHSIQNSEGDHFLYFPSNCMLKRQAQGSINLPFYVTKYLAIWLSKKSRGP